MINTALPYKVIVGTSAIDAKRQIENGRSVEEITREGLFKT
jgi:hypothetical protein